MSADFLDVMEELRRREFRRGLWLSLAAHALFVVAIAFAPQPSVRSLPPVVTVDLTASLPSARPAPRPAPPPQAKPAPAPAPPEPPPPPPPKKVVLPEKPQPLPEKPKRQERPPEPRPRPEPVDYEDALAQLRDELGEQAPPEGEAEPAETAEAEPAAGSPDGERIPPELAAWMKRAEIHVRRSWVTPQEFLDRRLVTRLRVTLSGSGDVIGEPEVTGSSGDPYYDENVVRAILRASPLPPPPESGDWPFVFSPREVR